MSQKEFSTNPINNSNLYNVYKHAKVKENMLSEFLSFFFWNRSHNCTIY